MCYAARVQILLASVDIRISTETYLAARPITSHHTTQHLACSLHPSQCRLLRSNWATMSNIRYLLAYGNQPIFIWNLTQLDEVLMLNVKLCKKIFCIFLVFTFQHRNGTLVRLLQSPAVMLRLGYSVGEDRADICGQLRPGTGATAALLLRRCGTLALPWHTTLLMAYCHTNNKLLTNMWIRIHISL